MLIVCGRSCGLYQKSKMTRETKNAVKTEAKSPISRVTRPRIPDEVSGLLSGNFTAKTLGDELPS